MAANPSLIGLKNALGENEQLEDQAVEGADQYYRGALDQAFGNPQATAELQRQRAYATMPGDPSGMRAFLQAIHNTGGSIGKTFTGTPEPSSTASPAPQTGTPDTAAQLAALSTNDLIAESAKARAAMADAIKRKGVV